MNLVRDLERRLERLVDGVSGWVARGPLHPVELASRVLREADLSLEEGPAGVVAPNDFIVRLGSELPPSPHEWEDQLAFALEETAAERGWRLEGPASVKLRVDPDVSSSMVEVAGGIATAPRSAWGNLVSDRGITYPLTYNRCVIGRSSSSDVVITDKHISRSHALLYREGGSRWIRDLGSANGTYVGSSRASTALPVTVDTVIALGPVTLRLR